MPTQNEREDAAERAFESAFEGRESETSGGGVAFSGGYEATKRRVREAEDEADRTNRENADAGTDM